MKVIRVIAYRTCIYMSKGSSFQRSKEKKRKDGSKLERQQAATLELYNNITEGKTCVCGGGNGSCKRIWKALKTVWEYLGEIRVKRV